MNAHMYVHTAPRKVSTFQPPRARARMRVHAAQRVRVGCGAGRRALRRGPSSIARLDDALRFVVHDIADRLFVYTMLCEQLSCVSHVDVT